VKHPAAVIDTNVVVAGLITADAVRERAKAALPDYVGNLERVRKSVEIACGMIAKAVPRRAG